MEKLKPETAWDRWIGMSNKETAFWAILLIVTFALIILFPLFCIMHEMYRV